MITAECLAPVVLFVYGRLDHTERTVRALLLNELAVDTDLIVYSDGARNAQDVGAVEEVRSYVRSLSGFKSVTLKCRSKNFGLAKNIIEGVTETFLEHERLIILEDDLVTAPTFLRYMNDALTLYAQDERVVSVHGYIYPVKATLPDVFFLLGADCWGWATWRRGWQVFNGDGQALLAELERKKLSHAFDFDGSYPYTQMLKDQVAGKNSSWAIRWYASAFLAEKLTMYPARSLVRNIGNDNSGTHCAETDQYDVELNIDRVNVGQVPVSVSQAGRQAFIRFFRSNGNTLEARLMRRVRRLKKWFG